MDYGIKSRIANQQIELAVQSSLSRPSQGPLRGSFYQKLSSFDLGNDASQLRHPEH
jgi:hypothetical protein